MSWHLRPLGTEIAGELKRLGPSIALGDIVRVWPEAVGAAIAANAWPARLARDGTLHVAARSSPWAFELTQLESAVRARLREHLGDDAPRALRFAPGPLPEAGPEHVEKHAPKVPKAGPGEQAAAAEIASAIGDSELRRLVARAAAASLARRGADRPI
jgi:predicted nucleic acid-binding Zn ribbon protein